MKTRNLLIVALVIGMLAVAFGGPAIAAPAFRIAIVMPSARTDMAFSQSMWDALKALQREMGGESALQIAYSEDMFKVPDAAAAIRDYAGQGFNIVLAHGSQYGS
jgi:basic membrane protein A